MFERFTDSARRVVVRSQEESRVADDRFIGTEHLLLALTDEDEGVAVRALRSSGISAKDVRRRVGEAVSRRVRSDSGNIPFTIGTKKALEMSLREARALGHDHIDSGHLLLGLLRVDDNGAHILTALGADLDALHAKVVELIDEDARRGNPT
jgi:ATP-dependent Clp protease ATP-binding subunit ClpA